MDSKENIESKKPSIDNYFPKITSLLLCKGFFTTTPPYINFFFFFGSNALVHKLSVKY